MSKQLSTNPEKSYLSRLAKRVWKCTWDIGKTQQIITWAVIAIITTVIGIYFGIVSGDPKTIVLALLSSVGVLLLCILILNLLRAPFQLDREKTAKINELETTLFAIQTQPANELVAIVGAPPSLEEDAPNPPPVLVSQRTDLVNVGFNSSKVVRQIKTKSNPYEWSYSNVATIEFHNKPVASRYVSNLSVIAVVTNLANSKFEVIKQGVWLDRWSDRNELETGGFIELGVGFVERNKFYLLEREYLEHGKLRESAPETFRVFDGSAFKVEVQLIAKDGLGAVLATPTFHYEMAITPKFKFQEVKQIGDGNKELATNQIALNHNSITEFRIATETDDMLTVEVWYVYKGEVGKKGVLLYAYPLDESGAHVSVDLKTYPAKVIALNTKAIAKMSLRYTPPHEGATSKTTHIECCIMHPMKGILFCQIFPYEKIWK